MINRTPAEWAEHDRLAIAKAEALIREVSREEALRLVKANGWRGLPLSTLDETYYFDGPEQPDAGEVFGDKPDKRPWRMIHKWAGYGPERFVLPRENTGD